jgi:hypothetical protein
MTGNFVATGNQNQPHTYCLGLYSLTETDLYDEVDSPYYIPKPLRPIPSAI